MADELTIHHLGRLTRATARGGDAQLKKLRNALLLKNFVIAAERENVLEFRRRAYLTQDDWPMRVIVRRDGPQFEIDCYLYIPWGWIAAFHGFDAAGAAVRRHPERTTGVRAGGGGGGAGDLQAKIRLPARRAVLAATAPSALGRDHGTTAAGSLRPFVVERCVDVRDVRLVEALNF